MADSKLTSFEAEVLLELIGGDRYHASPVDIMFDYGLSKKGLNNIIESLLAIKRLNLNAKKEAD